MQTIFRCSRFRLQSPLVSSVASQSSNCGCVGGSPMYPKSLGDRLKPCPKCCCHVRLAMTREVKGCWSWVSHFARAQRRRVVSPGKLSATACRWESVELTIRRNEGMTSGPKRSQSPRIRRWLFAGDGFTSSSRLTEMFFLTLTAGSKIARIL